MRDGQYITDGNFKDMDMDYIIKNMVGREIKENSESGMQERQEGF